MGRATGWVMAVVLGFSAPALAQQSAEQEAKALFNKGTTLYSGEKFEEAAEAFRKAHELKPSWKLLYNIGQAEASCRRQGLAIEAFEKYLAEGGDEVPVERRDQVYAEIDKLRRIVGSVALVAPAGLTVWVDGFQVGTTPLSGRLRVSASVEHLIELKDGDVVVDSAKVTVAGQETVDLRLSRANADAPPPTAEPGSAETTDNPVEPVVTDSDRQEQRRLKWQRQSRHLWIAGWVVAGVGAAGLIGGGITGGLALKKDKELAENGCNESGQCPTALEADLNTRNMLADLSSLLFIGGGVAAVAGTVLLLVSVKKKKKAEQLVPVSVVPVFNGNAGLLVLEGRF